MTLFDAVTHAMTTLPSSGFSNYDSSMGHFTNSWIHWVAVLFMITASLPFVLYVQAMREKAGVRPIIQDDQVREFGQFLAATVLFLSVWLWLRETKPFLEVLRQVAFHVTSIVTTTGFTMSDYSLGGPLVFEMFFFLLYVGDAPGRPRTA
jgi:trk system potassium uptake protein TrkH